MSTAARPAVAVPELQRHGGAVLITGRALSQVIWAVGRGAEVATYRDHRPDLAADLRGIGETLLAAARSTSDYGRADVRHENNVRQCSGRRSHAQITIAQASKRAKLSPRQCRRIAQHLAQAGEAHRVQGHWQINPDALDAYLNDQKVMEDSTIG